MAKPAKEFRLVSTDALPDGLTQAVVEFIDEDGVAIERITLDVPASDDVEAALIATASQFATRRRRESDRDTKLTPGRVFQLDRPIPPGQQV